MKKLIFALGLLSLLSSTFGQTWQTKLYLDLLENGSEQDQVSSLRVLRNFAGDPRVSKKVLETFKRSKSESVKVAAIKTLSLGGNRSYVYRSLIELAHTESGHFSSVAMASLYTLSMKSPTVRNYLQKVVASEIKKNLKSLEKVENISQKVWALRKLVTQRDVRETLILAYFHEKRESVKETIINAMFETRNRREIRDWLFEIFVKEESTLREKVMAMTVLKYSSLTNDQQRDLAALIQNNSVYNDLNLELLSGKRNEGDVIRLNLDYKIGTRAFRDPYEVIISPE